MRWLLAAVLLASVAAAEPPKLGSRPTMLAGSARRTTTPAPVSDVTAAFTATTLQGAICVAPCVVHFDGALTNADAGYSREFHEMTYRWGFGDTAADAQTWWHTAETGISRNEDFGPIVGHVYETAGTYTARLDVTAPDGQTDHVTHTVTVADPATLTTWCFSDDASFAGCPNDANGDGDCLDGGDVNQCTTLAANQFDDALTNNAYCNADGAKARCLFKGGDTFSSNAMVTLFRSSAPGLIGTFGTGHATVNTTAATQFDIRDGWQITGLDFNCGATDSCGFTTRVYPSVAVNNAGLYDMSITGKVSNCDTEIAGGTLTANTENWFVANTCTKTAETASGASGWILQTGPRQLIIGNRLNGAHYRIQQLMARLLLSDSAFSHNDITQAGDAERRCSVSGNLCETSNLDCADGGAPGTGGTCTDILYGPVQFRADDAMPNTRNEIAYNRIESFQGPSPGLDFVKICSHHSGCDNTGAVAATSICNDVLLENNFFRVEGDPNLGVAAAIRLQCSNATVRNNVMDLQGQGPETSPSTGPQIVVISALPSGVASTGNNAVYGNTVYATAENNGLQWCLNNGDTGGSNRCDSNLAFAPSMTGAFVAPGGAWADITPANTETKTTTVPAWWPSAPSSPPTQGATDFLDFIAASGTSCDITAASLSQAGAQRGCIVH